MFLCYISSILIILFITIFPKTTTVQYNGLSIYKQFEIPKFIKFDTHMKDIFHL